MARVSATETRVHTGASFQERDLKLQLLICAYPSGFSDQLPCGKACEGYGFLDPVPDLQKQNLWG